MNKEITIIRSVDSDRVWFLFRECGQEIKIIIKPDNRYKSSSTLFEYEIEYFEKYCLKNNTIEL